MSRRSLISSDDESDLSEEQEHLMESDVEGESEMSDIESAHDETQYEFFNKTRDGKCVHRLC